MSTEENKAIIRSHSRPRCHNPLDRLQLGPDFGEQHAVIPKTR